VVSRPLDAYRRILVIKLGALGDFVQAMGAMAQIRRAHPRAAITLLTTPPFAELADASGYFDAIDPGGRPKGWAATLRLIRLLRAGRYERVYDLQTSTRSSAYFYTLAPLFPEWSGIALGASHRHRNPRRNRMQNQDRLWDQLATAGVVAPLAEGLAPPPDLSWAEVGLAQRFALPARYALLAPGASPSHPRKRWPTANYAGLAQRLERMAVTPVVIGGAAETALAQIIAHEAPSTVDLTGRTSLEDLAALGAGAALVVGNDTGPTHLTVFAGAPAVVLFSSASNSALCAPRSDRITVLQKDDLADLSVDAVTKAVQLWLGGA
jgi:ADP-heptose:LPS heptosyltransferase